MIAATAPASGSTHGTMPPGLAVTGATGALGVHFIRRALARTSLPIRVLVHRRSLPADLCTPRVTAVPGNLLEPATLDRWLCRGAAVVHLAWSAAMTRSDQDRSAAMLADAVARHEAGRLVHCSTAVVAGRTRATLVSEDTPCEPATEYERSKYAIELALVDAAAGRFPLTILRPAAVFGEGLQNLVSLIEALRRGNRLVNYARSSLFGKRQLHLVPAETVAEALLLAALGSLDQSDAARQLYIVSADNEPGGDFSSIERRIRHHLARGRPAAPLPVPAVVLRAVLAVAGRSDTDPQRLYDGSRLRAAGFVPPVTRTEALDRYLAWYVSSASRGSAVS
jgi:nucleoside-diphosphate-sugar epimerase